MKLLVIKADAEDMEQAQIDLNAIKQHLGVLPTEPDERTTAASSIPVLAPSHRLAKASGRAVNHAACRRIRLPA